MNFCTNRSKGRKQLIERETGMRTKRYNVWYLILFITNMTGIKINGGDPK